MVAYGITRGTFYLALPFGDATSGKGSLRSGLVARRCLLRALVNTLLLFVDAKCALLSVLNKALWCFLAIDVS